MLSKYFKYMRIYSWPPSHEGHKVLSTLAEIGLVTLKHQLWLTFETFTGRRERRDGIVVEWQGMPMWCLLSQPSQFYSCWHLPLAAFYIHHRIHPLPSVTPFQSLPITVSSAKRLATIDYYTSFSFNPAPKLPTTEQPGRHDTPLSQHYANTISKISLRLPSTCTHALAPL